MRFGSDLDFRSNLDRLAYIAKYLETLDITYHAAMDKDYWWLEHMPNLTKGLVARGYSDEEVIGIIGWNWFNLFKRVWRGRIPLHIHRLALSRVCAKMLIILRGNEAPWIPE